MALLTVYTMGDIPIFTSVLNGVAMVFKSSMFDPAQGASIFVLGFIITVLLLIIPVTWGGKLNPMPLIFLIFLLYAGTYPKESLQVEDIYSGTATIVADIPLIISLPASVTASGSKKITDVVETAFQTTNGSYLAMGAEGFVNPLKLMLSLRDPNQTMRAFPYLSQSITEYIKYCAATDTTFSTKILSSSADMVAYLASLQVSGVMTYWDVANPMGFGTSCADGKARLKADTSQANMLADAERVMKSSTGGDYSKNATGLGASMAGLKQSYNSVTSGILGNMQTAQSFMVNAVAMVPTKQGIDCINQPTGPNMSECMGNVIQREALEKQNIDAAAQAGIFTKTMIPAMNILLLMFYAFAPIIIGYAFLAGPHALKMLAGYLLFGVWTQSWMPIAAIMNYIIQMQTQYAFSAFPNTGFTMENYMQFYSILTMKLGIASTLMASIPMITFGLLSGSAMAMTNVAGSMSARDYTDESKVAPSVGSNDAAVKNGAMIAGHTKTIELNSATGAAVGFDVARNGEFNPYGKADISKAAANAVDHKKAHAKSAGTKLDLSLANTLGSGDSKQSQAAWTQDITNATGTSDAKQAAAETSWASKFAETEGLDKSDQELLKAGIGLDIAGSGIAASKVFGMMKKKGIAEEIAQSQSFKNLKSTSHSEERRRSFAKNLQSSDSSILKNDSTNQVSSSVDQAVKAEEAWSRSEKVQTQLGTSTEFDMQSLGAIVNNRFTTAGAGNMVDNNVSEDKKQAYKKEEARILANARVANGGNEPEASGKTAAKLAALQMVDSDAYLKTMQQMGVAPGETTPEGVNIDTMNKPTNDKAGKIPEKRVEKVEGKTKPAENLHHVSGANRALVEGFAKVADSAIEQSIVKQDNLGAGGDIGRARVKAEQEASHKFLEEAMKRTLVDENGHIESMANVAAAAEQWSSFSEAHPVAAAAITMLPIGHVFRAAEGVNMAVKGVQVARTAVADANAALKTAESGVRMAERTGNHGLSVVKANEELHKAQMAAQKVEQGLAAAQKAEQAARVEMAAKAAKAGLVGVASGAAAASGNGA